MKNLLFILLLGLVSSQSAGMFTNIGESFISIEGQYDAEDFDGGSITTISVGGTYVLAGNIEMGVQYDMGKATYNNNNPPDTNINGLSFGGYYHIKESTTLPINIKFGGFYGNANASADWLDDSGLEIESNGSGIGGGIYKNIYENNNLTMIGFFNFHSIAVESTVSDSYGSTITDDDYNATSFVMHT